MTQNVGILDRAVRVILGLALLAFASLSGHAYSWIGWIGIIPVLTVVVGFCPLYAVLGLSTRKVKRAYAALPRTRLE